MNIVRVLCLVLLPLLAFGCGNEPVEPPVETPDASTPPPPPPPPPAVCEPACTDSQRCNTELPTPECEEVCNTPTGCNPCYEKGNVQTATCEPVTCNGAQCERGQGCLDITVSNFARDVANAVCSCHPAYNERDKSYPDSCAAYGMVCEFDRTASPRKATKCTAPREGQPCIQSVGCATIPGVTLECRNVGGRDVCTRSCTSAADCPGATDTCGTNGFCELNFCARNPDGSLDRSKLLGPCNAVGTNDGTCIPQVINGREVGVCHQSGSAATGEECAPSGLRTAPDKLCGVGSVCEAVQADANGVVRGLCHPLCNAATGATANPVKPCASGTRCRQIVSGQTATRVGACHAECDLVGGSGGCADDALGNEVGCYQWSNRDAAKGICISTHPNAGAANSADCGPNVLNDERRSCQSRMTCIGFNRASERCWKYCDLQACPNLTTCGACNPGATRCVRPGQDNNIRVGICQP
ncbi:MAG: hypothetical protein ACK4N5_01640 [Myxococcales bacterium]